MSDNWLPWARFPLQISAQGLEDALQTLLHSAAVESGRCVFRDGWSVASAPALLDEIDAVWAAHGGKRVMQSRAYIVWAAPNGVLAVQGDSEATTYEMCSFDPEFLTSLRALTETTSGPSAPPSPTVRVLEHEAEYYFSELKVPTSPFIRSNYDERVAAQYDVVLAGITQPNPFGHLTLLTGEPGTGKSHFVRGLLEDAREQATFCLVPPHMLASLNGPDLIGALRSLREPTAHRRRRRRGYEQPETVRKTIVIVLEDADACLVPRGLDNVSTIAALLNMSDGIFGAALDLRLIATTNAESFEIDPAISRAGRLLAHVVFQKLKPAEANGVLERLGAAKQVSKPTTLADLYGLAKETE